MNDLMLIENNYMHGSAMQIEITLNQIISETTEWLCECLVWVGGNFGQIV